jgi:hypothetical protein
VIERRFADSLIESVTGPAQAFCRSPYRREIGYFVNSVRARALPMCGIDDDL